MSYHPLLTRADSPVSKTRRLSRMVRAKKSVERILQGYVPEKHLATLILEFSASRTRPQLVDFLKTSWEEFSEHKQEIYAWKMRTTQASQRYRVVPEWETDLDGYEIKQLNPALNKKKLYRGLTSDAFDRATEIKWGPHGTPKIVRKARGRWGPYPI